MVSKIRIVTTVVLMLSATSIFSQIACLTYFTNNYGAVDNCEVIEGVPRLIIEKTLWSKCYRFRAQSISTRVTNYAFGEATNENSDTKNRFVYDSMGHLLEARTFYDEGEAANGQKYEIEDSGRIIIEYISNGYDYDKVGQTQYYYDEKNRLIKIEIGSFNIYQANEDFGKYTLETQWLFEYNQSNLVVWVKKYGLGNGEDEQYDQMVLKRKTHLVYDSLKRLIRTEEINKYSGGSFTNLRFVYKTNKISVIMNQYAKGDFRTDFLYDSKGKLLFEESYWNQGNELIDKKKYSYDERGTLKRIDNYDKNILKETIEIF